MIPTPKQAKDLWRTYHLSKHKQRHANLVALVSRIFAVHLERHAGVCIQKDLLFVSALLHDIDKNIPSIHGETHPDTAVLILHELGMTEVADVVKTHPLHAILDNSISPKTWEEKLLFLADKMTKYDVITVDERFRLWNEEHLSPDKQFILDAAYPKVKQLEQEVMECIQSTSEQMINICKNVILQEEGDTI
ncbi:MAG: HD domain-containing protein [Candidatus Gottesmanbacteria bacterium]